MNLNISVCDLKVILEGSVSQDFNLRPGYQEFIFKM